MAVRALIFPGRWSSACAFAISRRPSSAIGSCAISASTSAPLETMGALALLHFAVGAALAIVAWLMPRRVARCRRAGLHIFLLDMAPLGLRAVLLGFPSGRPLFSRRIHPTPRPA